MAYLNGLIGAVNPPSGMWENIISAFEGALGNYVLAIILLTVVIKVVWSFVELLTKWNQRKMSLAQAAMQPELDKIAKKYEKQPQLLQQKQNEVRNRYMGKSQLGGCLIMIITMALNMVVFFTLFAGLNNMAAYKGLTSYENTKFEYVNALYTVDAYWDDSSITEETKKEVFEDFENISFKVEEGKMVMSYTKDDVISILAQTEYKTDFSGGERQKKDAEGNLMFEEDGVTPVMETISSNENIVNLIKEYFPSDEEGNHDTTNDVLIKAAATTEEQPLYRSGAVQSAIIGDVYNVYKENQESFLWIKNIWVADSSLKNGVVEFGTIKGYMGKNYQEGEDIIYSVIMGPMAELDSRVNGFFILPALCFLMAFLTSFVNDWYNKRKYNKDIAAGRDAKLPQKTGKVARILMPALMAVFALFYNSVFAAYLLVGQMVSLALMIPQLMLVDKIIDKSNKKKGGSGNGNTVVVDYSRKF